MPSRRDEIGNAMWLVGAVLAFIFLSGGLIAMKYDNPTTGIVLFFLGGISGVVAVIGAFLNPYY